MRHWNLLENCYRVTRMKRSIEKVLVAITPPFSLLICPLLFPVAFSSTLSVIVVVVVVTMVIVFVVGWIPLIEPSLLFVIGGIRDFSQAKIVFPTWRLLGNPQDVSDQFFRYIYPSFAWMVHYFFYLQLTSHEFNPMKSNDCGLSRYARKSVSKWEGIEKSSAMEMRQIY